MTVKEFVELSVGSAIIQVVQDETLVAMFDTDFHKSVSEEILNLHIIDYKIEPVFMDKPSVFITAESAGVAYAGSYEDVLAAIDDDSVTVINLTADISAQKCFRLSGGNKSKTVNLNGFNVTAEASEDESEISYCFAAGAGCSLTINADAESYCYGGAGAQSIAVWANGEGASVTVNGGVYDVGSLEGDLNDTIYAAGGGQIHILAGNFRNSSDNGCKVLQCQNGTGSIITCAGGVYFGQNPADGDDSGTPSTFLAEGYEVAECAFKGEKWYAVLKED